MGKIKPIEAMASQSRKTGAGGGRSNSHWTQCTRCGVVRNHSVPNYSRWSGWCHQIFVKPPSLNRLLTFMSLGIVGPLLRPKLGPGSSGFTNLDVQTQTKRVGIHLIRASFLKKTGLTSITCNFEVACENGDTGNLCMSSLPSSGTNDFSLPAQCTVESDLLKDPTGELYKTCRQVGFLYLLNLHYFTTQAKMYNSICLFWSGWERQLHLPCFQVLLKKCHRGTLSRVGISHPPPLTLEKNVFQLWFWRRPGSRRSGCPAN